MVVELQKMKPQLRLHLNKHGTPCADTFVDVENRRHAKPLGGFWTSTFDKEIGSAWLDWARQEIPRMVSKKTRGSYLLLPKSANICIINCIGDARILEKKYPHPQLESLHTYGRPEQLLDWEAIAKDFDAVHLTHQGYKEIEDLAGEYDYDCSFFSWDCESTLWFRWCFEKVETIEVEKA